MSDNRYLIVAVESTAALERYWKSIMSDYLEKIIRSFAGNGLAGQKSSSSDAEFALIQFNAPGKNNPYIVQTSGLTKNVDMFMEWLSTIHFHGDGVRDVPLSEGIAKALMKFPTSTNGSNVDKHCILVAASNPVRDLPDAESIAKHFSKVPASLSVISPKQLPRLRAIYDAAKHNPSLADPAVDNRINPNFLVLISGNFMEARQALSCPLDTAVEGSPHASISAGSQMVQSGGIGVNQNLMSGLRSSGPSRETGRMIPTPGIPRQVQTLNPLQSIGVNSTSVANMQLPQQTSSILISTHLPYVKTWEGKLYARTNKELCFIANLEGHRSSLASAMLTANWPSTIHMVAQKSLDHINYELIKHHVENTSFLVFRASEHGVLLQLQELNRCVVIPLPYQTMLLFPTDRQYRLVGVVFPGDLAELNRQLLSWQLQHRQQRVESGMGSNQYEAVGTPRSSTNNQRPERGPQGPYKMPLLY